MTGRVAVIGAGPCGLSQLRAFQQAKAKGAEIPEIVCFEKQSDWGGLWNYTWRSGTDEYGELVHSSMYRYLWSNGPKECLEFADYTFDQHFKQPIPSFPPREVLYDYITGRAKEANVRPWVRFGTAVRSISYDKDSGQFSVTAERLSDRTLHTETFDWWSWPRAISRCRTCRSSPASGRFPAVSCTATTSAAPTNSRARMC